MAKVMMDSEIVEALATLAAHGIEAMKVKPKVLVEDAQWDQSILEAAGPGRPFEFNTIKGDIKQFSDSELRMELLRRGHQVPELGKGVKYGPVTKEEEKNGYQVWLAAPGISPYQGISAALEDFAKSRGIL